jgi:hypothetical protein
MEELSFVRAESVERLDWVIISWGEMLFVSSSKLYLGEKAKALSGLNDQEV